MSKSLIPLIFLLLSLRIEAGGKKAPSPGFGYPGTIAAYQASASLQASMAKFNMTAGWFRRAELPDEYVFLEKPQANEIPYLLYTPKRGPKPVPMVVYFGGTGEQGTDLAAHFRQTTVFTHLTTPDFQKRHPCYIFAPMPPKGAVIRAALPGERSQMADLICDAMYAVIASQRSPGVDTNRLYVTGLSWGGVAAFELSCSYPGRFAACVPTACIQSPMRIPKKNSGNYWMLYNENSYKSDWSQGAIRKIAQIVGAGGGDFRRSTFPDAGHDAWSKAWREDAVWEWVFSKGVKARSVRAGADMSDVAMFGNFAEAKATASLPGKDGRHGPERFLDGLDATAYASGGLAHRGDWVEIAFATPVKGRFRICSGFRDGSERLTKAVVESSTDGKRWRRAGAFSGKTGEARIDLRSPVRRIRVVYDGARPGVMVLRKIVKEAR